MSDDINYKNNPLHGLGLKALLTELVEHYGFTILYAYMNINCFKTNPSIESSIKFLKKTDWAREKVEAFYLYQFKSLPRASQEQFALPPRDRVIPEGDEPGEPAALSLEDAEQLRAKQAKKAADYDKNGGRHRTKKPFKARSHSGASRSGGFSSKASSGASSNTSDDPWANWKNNNP